MSKVILLAEDDQDEVFLLRRALEKSRVRADMHVVPDGEQVMAYLKAEGKYADRLEYPFPSFLLLDLGMPRMNGLEVLDAIRRDPNLTRLIVIIFTVSEHSEDICRACDLHANSYLIKPADLNALYDLFIKLDDYWLSKNQCAPCSPCHSNTPTFVAEARVLPN